MPYPNIIRETDLLQKQIAQLSPLGRDARSQLREHYRISLTWASNALEGNSLTEPETRAVIEEGTAVGGKALRDHLAAVGHSEAYDHLCRLAARAKEITEGDIRALHRLLYRRLDPARAGRYCRQRIVVPGSDFAFPAPGELKGLMARFVEGMPQMRAEKHPVEFAALLHLRLLSIHPFVDGNGRTARLLMNLALLRAGYPITIISPSLRSDYLAAIRQGDAGNSEPFINLLAGMVLASQEDYLRRVRSLQRD